MVEGDTLCHIGCLCECYHSPWTPKISSANKTKIIEEETQVKDSVTLQQIHSAVESLRKETDTLFVHVGK